MENYLIKKTKFNPKIKLSFSDGILDFEGISMMDNTYDFYMPIFKWVEEYLRTTNNEQTIINFMLQYFNSSTAKWFIKIFGSIEDNINQNKKVVLNWHCYDEDEELLDEVKTMTKFVINIIEVKDED